MCRRRPSDLPGAALKRRAISCTMPYHHPTDSRVASTKRPTPGITRPLLPLMMGAAPLRVGCMPSLDAAQK